MKNGKAFFAIITSLVVTSISCNNKEKTLFEEVPASTSHITFNNKLESRPLFNILYYLYFYNGGGVATGDVNNDGLPDVYFTANSKGANKLYLNKGNFVFEDITEKAGVAGSADWCTGVTMGDVNSDGFLDIYVSSVNNRYGLKGHNELYINNGNGTFAEKSIEYGLNFAGFTTQSAFFDYDRDGDLDCYILNQSHHPHANIVDTMNRRKVDSLSGDRLYRNELDKGLQKFTDVSAEAGIYQSNLGYGLGLAIGDLNNDGWDDLYIGNDFHENDYYYINNGNGTFTESGSAHFRHYSRFSMGNDIADYNNDGQLDVITVDMLPSDEKILKTYGSDENPDTYTVKLKLRGYQDQYSKNCLQRNNGNGTSFSEMGLSSGVSATDWSWAPLFADFDNDGHKDLFVTSGIVKRPVDLDYVRFVSDMQIKKNIDKNSKYDDEVIDRMPDGSSYPFLFKGDGQYKFKEVSKEWGTGKMKGYFTGAAYADLDNDGDLDLVTNCINSEAMVLRNNAPPKNFLTLSFDGATLNKFGIGTKAWIFQNGKIQFQQLMLTRGFESSCDAKLNFGLGESNKVDSMLIVWPNQQYQVIKGIAANKPMKVKQTDAAGEFNYASFFPQLKNEFENITDQIQCDWRHKENDFNDFNVQYLIPHKQSTRGPKIAVADVNNDGLDDFYACGAKDQPGALMIQQSNGNFKASDTALFSKYAVSEEVDALFFDANGDTYPDLFVLTGGNEVPASELALHDRLYLNNKKGGFEEVKNPMPIRYENKSCIAAADVDNDGDQDLFIGNLAGPTTYGLPRTSYFFMNNGDAHFTSAGDNIIPLTEIGMVTAASFMDVDKDGWQDLVVTGEWMPMRVFKNNKGKFTPVDVAQSTGLWQTIYPTDVNNDGHMDFLAGNWGHNTKLWAGKNGPCKLYVKDFDRNGSVEQIMAYTIDKNEYTFLAKDELERALPVLKKAYLNYSEVAGKTVQYMFYDLFKDYKELTAETLSSSCFMNDGKGNFIRKDLPDEFQLAPIFSFTSLGNNANSWLAGGNFYGVVPYEGRYDALLPTTFSFNKQVNDVQAGAKINGVDGEIRDAKWINAPGKTKVLIVARNDKPLLFFRTSK